MVIEFTRTPQICDVTIRPDHELEHGEKCYVTCRIDRKRGDIGVTYHSVEAFRIFHRHLPEILIEALV